MSDAFSRYHPLVNFLFFALVLAYSMVLMHPVCLAVSLTGALVYAGELGGRRALAGDRKSTRLNSSHSDRSRMPSSA